MKTSIFTLALFIGSGSFAQTISYSNFSQALSQPNNVKIGNLSTFNVALTTTTGTGITWDASGIQQQGGTPLIQLIYATPGSTPNGSLYPLSNYVNYDPALTAFVSYDYMNFGLDSIVSYGSYSPSTSHEIFQNPEKKLIFPFNYSQSFVDNYEKTNYSDATTISSYQTGTWTIQFNGYGTLKLPQGDFTNVGLISGHRTNSLGPDSYTYEWFDLSNGKKLLYYSSNDGDELVAYTNDPVAGIQENDINNVKVYPNPANEKINIDLSEVGNYALADFKLYDISGTLSINETLLGMKNVINVNALKAGVYIYTIDVNNQIFKGKLIIE